MRYRYVMLTGNGTMASSAPQQQGKSVTRRAMSRRTKFDIRCDRSPPSALGGRNKIASAAGTERRQSELSRVELKASNRIQRIQNGLRAECRLRISLRPSGLLSGPPCEG